MHRAELRKSNRRRMWPLAICLAVATVAVFSPPRKMAAADAMPITPAADSIAQSLRQILDGAVAPKGVTDLREMQLHVRMLSDQVKKCTVGVQVGAAWGSGVIISKDGYVLTAAHVAGKPNQPCKFTLADGKELIGTTLGLFRTLDAGLMKITEDGDYSYAEVGNSGKLREGQWCIAMGHPGGYQVERGVVLRLGRVLLAQDDAITTDCTLVGGDSGGPLFDMDGRVIGINSRIAELLTTNMHVPVNAFHERDAWNRMLKGEVWGRMPGQEPGWLGVGGVPGAKDAQIGTVKVKSPAERSGLVPGDVVIAFDGKEILDFEALKLAVDDCHDNESVVLRVRRGGEQLDVRVRLGKKPG
jgi:serine protease Do